MPAREAAQTAEDARLIALQRQDEERVARAQEVAAAREATALATAQSETRRREQAEAERAASDRRRLEAEAAAERAIRERQAAEAALGAAERARVEAERAQQRLAEERAAAEAARAASQASAEEARQAVARAEAEKADLRERLQRQLNIILETRETARGLIVNVSDVLFDTGQHTLTSGAREKLATVAGILLAYPGLSLEVDGHTDSVGDDDYNQALSERRAESVRGYLIQRGIPTTAIAARGYGESQPVASNDIPAGRQQNRRVELVVSGESIGRPQESAALRRR
jgi:outer membrane protein OmpA-like peptidoglycan-associated protein